MQRATSLIHTSDMNTLLNLSLNYFSIDN